MKTQRQPLKLLIVDDEEINMKLLASFIDDVRVQPLFATNGSDALLIAHKQHPDLILLDVVMPDISGYDVCKKLKSDPDTRDIPIIFLTGQNNSEAEAKGLALGAVDYIAKPYDPIMVRTKIENQFAHISNIGQRRSSGSTAVQQSDQRPWLVGGVVAIVAIALITGVGIFSGQFSFTGAPAGNVADAPDPGPGITRSSEQRVSVGLAAETQCGEFPDVDWWTYNSHVTVAIYVRSNFGSDWGAYLDVWTERHQNLVNLFEAGVGARILNADIVLSGDELATYVDQMAERVTIIECLREEATLAAR